MVIVTCASIMSLSLDIWVYSLFHRNLSKVHMCMLNILSMLQLMVYLERS